MRKSFSRLHFPPSQQDHLLSIINRRLHFYVCRCRLSGAEAKKKNAFACVLINNRWWCVASYTQADCVWLFSFFSVSLSGVGKSSLLIRFSDNTFSGSYITTIGVDFKIRTVLINGERVKLQIWDVSWYKSECSCAILDSPFSSASFRLPVRKDSEP